MEQSVESDARIDTDEELGQKNFTGKLSAFMINDEARADEDSNHNSYDDYKDRSEGVLADAGGVKSGSS